MLKKFLNLSFVSLVIISAAATAAVHTATGMVAYTKTAATADKQLTIADFSTESMKLTDSGQWVTTDSDPQLTLVVDGMFYGMVFDMQTTLPPGNILVYYTTAPQAPFSHRQMLWAQPVKGMPGTYRVDMPAQYIHTLRVDPSEYAGNFITFGKFALNPPKSAGDYLAVNHTNLPFMVIYTAMRASVLKLFQEILQKININPTKKQ